jgi:hypothetical protein
MQATKKIQERQALATGVAKAEILQSCCYADDV